MLNLVMGDKKNVDNPVAFVAKHERLVKEKSNLRIFGGVHLWDLKAAVHSARQMTVLLFIYDW